jgi:hypothetical protein
MPYFVPTRFVWRFGGKQVIINSLIRAKMIRMRPMGWNHHPLWYSGVAVRELHPLGRDGVHDICRPKSRSFCSIGSSAGWVRTFNTKKLTIRRRTGASLLTQCPVALYQQCVCCYHLHIGYVPQHCSKLSLRFSEQRAHRIAELISTCGKRTAVQVSSVQIHR